MATQAEFLPEFAQRRVQEPAERLDLRRGVDFSKGVGEPTGGIVLRRRDLRVDRPGVG